MTDFSQLNLPASLSTALKKLNFETPTPIQAQAIPLVLAGQDLIGCAQTGTGKTAAFGIPMIANLIANREARALILAPTRELALQITEVLRKLSIGQNDLWPALVMGGANMRQQMQHLRKNPRIIIATPGRLMDHMGQKTVNFERISLLVIDEADQMLDMGFAPQLNQILKQLPTERQTLLFSATLPDKIVDITKRFMKAPQRVTIGEVSRPIEAIKQTVLHTTAKTKNDMLLDELNAREGSILVFVRTKSRTERLNTYLEEYGYSVARIHGGRSQAQRLKALQDFRNGKIRILVATDVAARGLDIPHIAHVINYDMPMAPEDYIHRIGRTGRAGAVGESLSMLVPEDKDMWRRISRFIDPKGTKGMAQKTFSRPPIGANSRGPSTERPRLRPTERPHTRTAGRPQFERPGRAERPVFDRTERAHSERPHAGRPHFAKSGRDDRFSKPSFQKPARKGDRSERPSKPYFHRDKEASEGGFDRPRKSFVKRGLDFDRADAETRPRQVNENRPKTNYSRPGQKPSRFKSQSSQGRPQRTGGGANRGKPRFGSARPRP